MSSNINEFMRETNAEIKKLQAKQVSEAKQIVLGVYAKVTDPPSQGGFAPVDTGLFRHNNFLTVNSKTSKTTEEPHEVVIEGGQENVNKAKFKHSDTITIQNHLDYADALEAGHSSQAKGDGAIYGRAEEFAKKTLSKRIKIK